jgi:beta-phosphoglucomutase-like phosphatase (HAD superfamily)
MVPMGGKPGLIIFDNDGVLVDSEPLIKIAQVKAFGAQGAHITAEWSYANLHGLRAADVVRKVSDYTGVELDAEKGLADFKVHVSKLFKEQLKPTPYIIEAIQAIHALDIPTCIATSGPLEETYLKLDVCGLSPYFPTSRIFICCPTLWSGAQGLRGD